MGSAAEFIAGSDFQFEHTRTFARQRARQVADPYDPESTTEDWGTPDEIPLDGHFASQSSSEQTGEVREQVSTSKQLVIDDPAADVQRGDRIKLGNRTWTVVGFSEDDVNPFTGWQPTLVVNLEEWRG